jgi:integrase
LRLLVACQSSTWRKLRLLVLLAITTGMRRGNLVNLRHCDFNGNRIGPVLTKNGSQFVGVLTSEAAAELAKFLEPGSAQLMFEGLPGKPFLFDNALEKAFKAAGLTDLSCTPSVTRPPLWPLQAVPAPFRSWTC